MRSRDRHCKCERVLVALAVSFSFLLALLTGRWEVVGGIASSLPSILGLTVGGLFAALLAGLMVKRLNERVLLRAVGLLIVRLAGYQTAQMSGLI